MVFRAAFGRIMQSTWRNDLGKVSRHVETRKDTPIVDLFILTYIEIYAVQY